MGQKCSEKHSLSDGVLHFAIGWSNKKLLVKNGKNHIFCKLQNVEYLKNVPSDQAGFLIFFRQSYSPNVWGI